eukprot:jgi/Astpho2/3403/Aster-04737
MYGMPRVASWQNLSEAEASASDAEVAGPSDAPAAAGNGRPPALEDFPALGGPGRQAASPQAAAGAQRGRKAGQAQAEVPQVVGGPSEALKAANKALIEKMRGRLAPEAFARFKQQTAEFLHGQLTPAELHASAVRLELAALAPELAALCPDAERRAGLLQAHSDTFAEGCSTEAANGSWVPPEAALAAVEQATQNHAWMCAVCSRINAPQEGACENCEQSKAGSEAIARATAAAREAAEAIAVADAADRAEAAAAAASDAANSKGKGKGKKVPKFERLRLTGGDATATQNWLDTAGGHQVKPQNVWTRKSDAPGRAVASKGAWGSSGPSALTQQERALKASFRK